jgi:hypothetical protein
MTGVADLTHNALILQLSQIPGLSPLYRPDAANEGDAESHISHTKVTQVTRKSLFSRGMPSWTREF